jgi:hypothetical protein
MEVGIPRRVVGPKGTHTNPAPLPRDAVWTVPGTFPRHQQRSGLDLRPSDREPHHVITVVADFDEAQGLRW